MVNKETVNKIKKIIGESLYNRLSTDWYYRIPFDEILSAFDFLVGFEKQKSMKKKIEIDRTSFFNKIPVVVEYLKTLPEDAVLQVNPDNGHIGYVVETEEDDEAYKWRIRRMIARMECRIVAAKEKRDKLLKEKERLENQIKEIEDEIKELTRE